MVYEIAADRVMDVHLECELEFGADAVNAGNEDGIKVFGFIYGEEAAETADLAEDASGEGFVGKVLDALLGAVGLVYVDARVGVGDGFGSWGHDVKSIAPRGVLRESL